MTLTMTMTAAASSHARATGLRAPWRYPTVNATDTRSPSADLDPTGPNGNRPGIARGIAPTAVALVLALLVAATATVSHVSAATPGGEADAETAEAGLIAGVAEGDIDAFWMGRFAAAGYGYATPPLVGFDAPIATGCGTVQPSEYVSFYCTLDGAVYYSAPRIKRQTAIYGDAAWLNIMAHEWGHHVQAMLGLNPEWRMLNDVPGIEQEATCLEGVYVADAFARGLLDAATIGEMTAMFNRDAAHGSSEQLVAAFEVGFEGGFAGCGVGLPDAERGGERAATSGAAAGDTDAPAAPSASIAPGATVRVTMAGVNLRAAASTGAAVRTTLGAGQELLVTGESVERGGRTWWPVADEATGETGYVAGEFLAA